MEKEWIKRVREESKRKFEELLKKNMKVEGMYEIPEEYKDASKLHPVKASNHENKKMIKSIIDAENEVYKSMQYKIPEEIGKTLQSIHESDDYYLMIHRTDYHISQIMKYSFQKGIPMRSADYTCNLSKYKHFPTVLEQILVCNEYKNSQGCIIVKIPKNLDLPIYYDCDDYMQSSSLLCLMPEYIYGYIPVKDETIGEMVLNPLYTDNHDYDVDGLYYDSRLTPIQHKKQLENNRIK